MNLTLIFDGGKIVNMGLYGCIHTVIILSGVSYGKEEHCKALVIKAFLFSSFQNFGEAEVRTRNIRDLVVLG